MGETSTVTRDAFPNYAGKKDIDDSLAAELEAAGIEAHRYGFLRDGRREVDTEVVGELHGWGFRRAWYYWVAEGPGIEVAAAERLHAACGQHVRVNGHCGCPSPTEQNKGLAIGSYHVDRPSGLKALADTIRALVARSAAGATGDTAALAKLAEIPPAGSEERDFWLEAARQHGLEETSGGDQVPEYDPPAYFATADEVLKLMSEARKQGQRDVLAAGPAAGDGWEPIETADPPLEDVTADLPDGARDGLGWAVCDISGEFAYHTWWIYEGGGVSKVTHWRRPIAGPAFALAQREAARG